MQWNAYPHGHTLPHSPGISIAPVMPQPDIHSLVVPPVPAVTSVAPVPPRFDPLSTQPPLHWPLFSKANPQSCINRIQQLSDECLRLDGVVSSIYQDGMRSMATEIERLTQENCHLSERFELLKQEYAMLEAKPTFPPPPVITSGARNELLTLATTISRDSELGKAIRSFMTYVLASPQ